MRGFTFIGLAALYSGAVFGQSTETPAKFEIADVHVSPASTNPFPFVRGPFLRAGRYEIRMATMADRVRTAYGVDADKVLGGPTWLEMDRFDIVAKMPPAQPKPDELKTMLQALLADRFKLVVHNDTKALPAYSLTEGKHQGLKAASGSGETGCKFEIEGAGGRGGPPPPPPPGEGVRFVPTIVYTCRNMTMQAFADGMRGMIFGQQYLNGRPVVNNTDLKGAWDFTFKYSFRIGPAVAGAETITMFAAIDKQLGLKLEPSNLKMAVVVVDKVNQKPTENPPNIAESLPSSPIATEFEVADIKPADPEFKGMMMQNQPGGRLNMRGVNLRMLMQRAYDFDVFSDEMLVGAPKWIDTNRFDIVAKAPAATLVSTPAMNGQPARPAAADFDSVALMLRALLEDRFKLKAHFEDQPLTAYTLVAAKPKMKKADPTSRTTWKEGPPADGKDPRETNPALSRLITCQNMTMAQFAAKLQGMASGYIHSPVLDATGLEGGWDFTLNFSPVGIGMPGAGRGGEGAFAVGGPAQPGASATASDPTGGITLFDAMEKQLGLKLEKQKRPVKVLVIDHIEEKPTEN